jgi:hypothetical protein
MSKDARNDDLDLAPAVKTKFDELVTLLSQQGFGPDGPPPETTFAQIEQFGHQAGRMVARAIDARLAVRHAEHFAGEQPCPTCHEKCPPEESPHELPLHTSDGDVTLHEPTCRCPQCRRDFFPSADRVED